MGIKVVNRGLLWAMVLGLSSAHMEMSWPYPLRSKFDPQTPPNLIDYSMTSPLLADGTYFLTRGSSAEPQSKEETNCRLEFPVQGLRIGSHVSGDRGVHCRADV
jgi:hypothetical protein